MKHFKTFLLVIFFSILIVFLSIFFIFQYRGKQITESLLKNYVAESFSIGDIQYRFPFGILVEDLMLGQELRAGSVEVQFDPVSLFKGQPVLSRVTVIRFQVRLAVGNKDAGNGIFLKTVLAEQDKGAKKKSSPNEMFVGRLFFYDGEILLQDSGEGFLDGFRLHRVRLKAKNISFPLKDAALPFFLSGEILKRQSLFDQKYFESYGWVNLIQKDAKINVDFLRQDKVWLLKSEVVSEKGAVTARGTVRLGAVLFRWLSLKHEQILSGLKSVDENIADSRIQTRFSFVTDWDHPSLEKISFEGEIKLDENSEK